jgi:hypothetical protein
MTSAETPAVPSPKSSASGWQKRAASILAIVLFWTVVALAFTVALRKPKQWLRIENTGSQSVDIRDVSGPWWDEKTLTLHPGMTGLWHFRDGDQFRITRSTEAPPKPGTTPLAEPLPSRAESFDSELFHNADSSGTIAIKHAARTAEVRLTEAGKVEFEFTDL